MRWTKALIPTLKEDPQDAEVISHKLMVRGGFVRKLISGAYTYMPLGFRVLEKVKKVIRHEMDLKGSQEVLMPAIHPPEIWKRTGRYELLGEVLIKFKDRHGKEHVLGPTHEEIITDLVANNVKSYKELPQILYQIQTKFRDEPRPRFGVMRTSEFIMKDAYSFDCNAEGLEASYKKMYEAYCEIFRRCGLPYIPVQADTGMMGGSVSHEFMVPSPAGEDRIVTCAKCGYAASTEIAACKSNEFDDAGLKESEGKMTEVATPSVSTIEKVSQFLKVSPKKLVKTLIYMIDDSIVAVLLRGDHEANETKLKNLLKASHFVLADDKTIEEVTGGPVGFSGPVGLKIKIVADNNVRDMKNFIVGANKKDMHFVNVNLDRDFQVKEFGDIRMITADDKCPSCEDVIEIRQAIEVGHTFKLGTKYSSALEANFLDKDGKSHPAIMGCYGIGVTRILAGVIESNHDKDGIIWPIEIAPYQVIIIALNIDDAKVKEISEAVYNGLQDAGIEVLFDDRNVPAGVKFKDADLIGIPVKVIVGAKNAARNIVEVKSRKTGAVTEVEVGNIESHLKGVLKL